MNKLMAIEDWVVEHPYLNEIATLEKLILTGIEKIDLGYDVEESTTLVQEMEGGNPLLTVTEMTDRIIADSVYIFNKILKVLSTAQLPEKMIEQCKRLKKDLDKNNELLVKIFNGIINNNPWEAFLKDDVDKGFLLFLAWKALSASLEPVKEQLRRIEGFQWREGYCPVCGQLPALGQLIRKKKGRERELICGCCQMHWRYKRIGCPYCGNEDTKALSIIEIQEVTNLRIDTCENCKGYLKIFLHEEDESIVFTDWSTLFLDFVGKKQGFQRIGYQMYEV